MKKVTSPLLNAADAVATGGGATPPAPTQQAPAAPVNQAQPPAAPVNQAPPAFTLDDIKNAIGAQMGPIINRLEKLEGLQNHGITPGNLAGANPVQGAASPEAPKAVDFANMSAQQLIALGRSNTKATIKAE